MKITTAPTINLLSKKKVVFDKQAAIAVKVKVWTTVLLTTYALLLVGLVIVRLSISSQLASVSAELDTASLSISSSALVEQAYRKAVSKSRVLVTLMDNRRETVQLWKNLLGILPPGSELSSFSLSDNVLKSTVKTPHVLIANQVIDLAESKFSPLEVSKTTMEISRSSDARYTVTLDLQLDSTKQKAEGE